MREKTHTDTLKTLKRDEKSMGRKSSLDWRL